MKLHYWRQKDLNLGQDDDKVNKQKFYVENLDIKTEQKKQDMDKSVWSSDKESI